jgi:hypothetical protein
MKQRNRTTGALTSPAKIHANEVAIEAVCKVGLADDLVATKWLPMGGMGQACSKV